MRGFIPAGRRGSAIGLLLFAAFAGVPLTFAENGTSAEILVEELDGARTVAVAIPGALLDVSPACPVEEPCASLLLLTALDGPREARSLLRLDLGSPAPPRQVLRASLPERTTSLALYDLDADGTAEVLLGEPGRLYSLGAFDADLETSEPRLLLADRDVDLPSLAQGGFLSSGRLDLPALGALRGFVTTPEGDLRAADEAELPVRANRQSAALTLSTPPVTALGGGRFAVGPEAFGDRRLRTLLLAPRPAEPVEAWAELPAPEELRAARWAELDGRAVLIAVTVSAARIGVFEKQSLRVFAPRQDPTRSGAGPFFKAVSESYRWQGAEPHLLDANGDGRPDLVMVQQSGLGGAKVVVEVYKGTRGLGFGQVAARMTLKAPEPRWRYGGDVDGDGLPDLALLAGEEIRIHGGAAGQRPFAKRPRWNLTPRAPGSPPDAAGEREVRWWGRPEMQDVDGDGRAEVLLRGVRGDREHGDGDEGSVLWLLDPR